LIQTPFAYQLALITPGISPLSALFLKHILHKSNFRRYPRDRPHSGQRLYARTLNFGALDAFAIKDFFAIVPPSRPSERIISCTAYPDGRAMLYLLHQFSLSLQ